MPTQLVTVTIANGQSLSSACNISGYYVQEIIMPAAWDAAGLTFQVADAGGTFLNVNDTAGEYALVAAAVAASRRILLPATTRLGDGQIKLRSGTGAAAVNQLAERIITLKLRPANW